MDGGILTTVTDTATKLWNWSGMQDGRITLLVGAITWFAIERVWGLLHAPVNKILGVLGLLAILGIGGAFVADGKEIMRAGEKVPFENSVKNPNAGFFDGPRR